MPALSMVRQELFAQARSRGVVPDIAYIEAKYGDGSQTPEQQADAAKHLEAKPKVRARIAELMEQRSEAREEREEQRKDMAVHEEAMNQAEILEGLRTVFKLAIQQSVHSTKEGELVDGDPVNLGAANRALELMGKQKGMFADTKIIKNDHDFMGVPQLKAAIEKIDQLLIGQRRTKTGDDAKVIEATVIEPDA